MEGAELHLAVVNELLLVNAEVGLARTQDGGTIVVVDAGQLDAAGTAACSAVRRIIAWGGARAVIAARGGVICRQQANVAPVVQLPSFDGQGTPALADDAVVIELLAANGKARCIQQAVIRQLLLLQGQAAIRRNLAVVVEGNTTQGDGLSPDQFVVVQICHFTRDQASAEQLTVVGELRQGEAQFTGRANAAMVRQVAAVNVGAAAVDQAAAVVCGVDVAELDLFCADKVAAVRQVAAGIDAEALRADVTPVVHIAAQLQAGGADDMGLLIVGDLRAVDAVVVLAVDTAVVGHAPVVAEFVIGTGDERTVVGECVAA